MTQSGKNHHRGCLLCGSFPTVIGVFVPDNPEVWGGYPNKTRMFQYNVCEKCFRLPDIRERAEKVIRVELAGGVTYE